MKRATRAIPFVTACLVLALAGCGGNTTDRYAVSGTVKFKAALLDKGVIEFADPNVPGTAGVAEIQNGQYSLPRERGLPPGTYVVRISTGQPAPAPKDNIPGESPPPAPERIPEEYNTKSKLKAEVKADGPNTFDFSIP
jgi:hypothetical protein